MVTCATPSLARMTAFTLDTQRRFHTLEFYTGLGFAGVWQCHPDMSLQQHQRGPNRPLRNLLEQACVDTAFVHLSVPT